VKGKKDIKLYKGDCLEIMDDLISKQIKVDCIITDPPYGMSYKSTLERHRPIINDDNLTWLEPFAEKAFKLLKDNAHGYVFCSHHHIESFKIILSKIFDYKNILIWEKNNIGLNDFFANYGPKYEMIVYINKGKRELKGNREPNIFKFIKPRNELHPTQKPVDLIEYLISKSTDEGDVIIDPFMGSGTTGVACKNMKRNFIGIELDDEYYNIAKNRILQPTDVSVKVKENGQLSFG
jgi:site-specific DNA-methyltransferase (adenine-specific)